jgi:hypothetical protein
MLFVILSSFVTLVLIDRVVRIGNLRLAKDQARYELFALRDELRKAAITGRAPMNRWFDYMDSTLTRSIDKIYQVSLLDLMVFAALYRENRKIEEAVANRRRAFELPENTIVAGIYERYLYVLVRFMMNRNLISRIAHSLSHRDHDRDRDCCGDAASSQEDGRKSKAEVFSNVPATSTLLTYGLVPQRVAA